MSEESTPYEQRHVEVLGRRMAYVEVGEGPPIVLLHGNPTSSHLWRGVIPHLEGLGRCIAPDLIGMGSSDKLPEPGPGTYSFAAHARHLDELLAALGVGGADGDVTLVVHDWGSGLGFDWARRHPDALRGIAYMEAIVQPVNWEEWPDSARGIFQGMRGERGESLVLERNVFVERILPASVLRELSDDELAVYRRPYPTAPDRWPTLEWPRELPFVGEPNEVTPVVEAYAEWLARTDVPKLFVNAEPGSILVGSHRAFCRTWPNQTEVTVAGSHFIQEDSADAIGRAVAEWLRSLG
jgi:haloalkane dehalogenase